MADSPAFDISGKGGFAGISRSDVRGKEIKPDPTGTETAAFRVSAVGRPG
jgi:hypothetical protein